MRIWAKIVKGDKITKNIIVPTSKTYHMKDFEEYVQEICYLLDIPNPMILDYHFLRFMEFNNVKFFPDDFVEEVHFTHLILERVE